MVTPHVALPVGATFMGGGDARPIEDMVSEFASKMATLQKARKTPAT